MTYTEQYVLYTVYTKRNFVGNVLFPVPKF